MVKEFTTVSHAQKGFSSNACLGSNNNCLWPKTPSSQDSFNNCQIYSETHRQNQPQKQGKIKKKSLVVLPSQTDEYQITLGKSILNDTLKTELRFFSGQSPHFLKNVVKQWVTMKSDGLAGFVSIVDCYLAFPCNKQWKLWVLTFPFLSTRLVTTRQSNPSYQNIIQGAMNNSVIQKNE